MPLDNVDKDILADSQEESDDDFENTKLHIKKHSVENV
jgi:hypothetical protein